MRLVAILARTMRHGNGPLRETYTLSWAFKYSNSMLAVAESLSSSVIQMSALQIHHFVIR